MSRMLLAAVFVVIFWSQAGQACTTLSLTIPTTTYSFGDVGISSAIVNHTALPVMNDSPDCRQDFLINAATYSVNSLGEPGWTIATRPGKDLYQLCWQFLQSGAGRPGLDVSGVCNSSNWNLFDKFDYTLQYGSQDAGAADDVSTGAALNLWFQVWTPTSTVIGTEQIMMISITAAAGNSF